MRRVLDCRADRAAVSLSSTKATRFRERRLPAAAGMTIAAHLSHQSDRVSLSRFVWNSARQRWDQQSMKKNESIAKIMSSDLVTIDQSQPVSRARQLLESGDRHHLPVVNGDDLVGIISWNDILRVTFGDFGDQDGRSLDAILDHTYKLSDLANAQPVSIQVSGTVRDAAHQLASNNFHSLPVVDGNKLVGIVTSTDLIQYLVDQY
jgi:CBS domain-containing protein